jgi:flagellar protein FlaI
MPEPVAEEAQPVMARPAAAEPAASQPVPSPAADTVPEQEAPPVRQPVVEIIDEDPKAALRRAKAAKKILPVAAPVEDDQPLSVTDSDEKIVSVDQIKDLSGLILPKGATFQIDELKLHGRINSFDQPARAHSPGV